jgi:hypothetical protein
MSCQLSMWPYFFFSLTYNFGDWQKKVGTAGSLAPTSHERKTRLPDVGTDHKRERWLFSVKKVMVFLQKKFTKVRLDDHHWHFSHKYVLAYLRSTHLFSSIFFFLTCCFRNIYIYIRTFPFVSFLLPTLDNNKSLFEPCTNGVLLNHNQLK